QRILRGERGAGIRGRSGHGRPLGDSVPTVSCALGRCASPSLRATSDSFGAALAGFALGADFFEAAFLGAAFLGAAFFAVCAFAFFAAFFSAYRSASGSSSTGQSARVSRYSWRTSAMCSGSLSSVQSCTEIGGNTATSTVPGLITVEFL